MKKLFRIAAAGLATVICLTLAACHPKDEIAVTVGDASYISAMYAYALLQADSEARSKVDEATAADDTASAVTGTDTSVDYYAQKIDEKDYTTWVKDRAIEILKEYTVYEAKCKEYGIQPTDEEKNNLDQQTSMYWNYGFSTTYEANGISLATYQKAASYGLLSDTYFQKLYGAGGEKEVSQDEIKKTMTEQFVLADVLSVTYTSDQSDEDKAAQKTKFEGYLKQLQDGAPFAEIYIAHNGQDIEDSTDETAEGEEAAAKPQDKYAIVLGGAETSQPDDNFDEILGMKPGEIKLIEQEDNAGLRLVVRKDISLDPYYLDQLTDTILWMLKEDEFDAAVKAQADTYEVKTNNFAVNRFKVKKLKYPTGN